MKWIDAKDLDKLPKETERVLIACWGDRVEPGYLVIPSLPEIAYWQDLSGNTLCDVVKFARWPKHPALIK